MKVPVSFVAEVLKKHKIEPELLREIIEDINHDLADDSDEKQPAPKKQFVILLSDPEGKLPKQDLVGWVLKIEESASPFSLADRTARAIEAFNMSKRGRMLPVKTVGEAIESASSKYWKDSGVWISTKLPVSVQVTSNRIPTITTEKH